MQKPFQFIFLSFYKFTKMKILSFECPKSIRNYEKKYLERKTLGQWVVCPIGPGNQSIILYIVWNYKSNLSFADKTPS